jgi:hypothetical protein
MNIEFLHIELFIESIDIESIDIQFSIRSYF